MGDIKILKDLYLLFYYYFGCNVCISDWCIDRWLVRVVVICRVAVISFWV